MPSPVPSAHSRSTGFAPWTAVGDDASGPDTATGPANQARLARLRSRGHQVDPTAYVADEAVVDADHLTLGARSYLAAQTHVTGDVTIGADCSLNVFAAARGHVRIGDGVRVGASTSILGFDHEFADPDVPVRLQGLRTRGITIDDDVWVGAHVVVLDGVTIGAHSVIGAGSVVTKDIPPYAVAVGNPARVVRDRRTGNLPVDGAGDEQARVAARALGTTVIGEIPALLDTAWDPRSGAFVDAPGCAPTVRAHCDAIELGDLAGLVPGPLTPDEHLERFTASFPGQHALAAAAEQQPWEGPEAYHVLCVGSALDLLGAPTPSPPQPWAGATPEQLRRRLDSLDWAEHAWHAGSVVDTIGTALTLAGADRTGPAREALIGWLMTHRDPSTGLWGSRTAEGLREAVNGTYRLVRGTLAPWGIVLGGGDVVVDAVLRHVRDGGLDRATACDALDVAYLLWWAWPSAREYRAAEVAETAYRILDLALAAWSTSDAPGAPFAPLGTEMVLVSGVEPTRPSLQGSEMWAALAWYAADLLGCPDALGYTPRGIHRPARGPA